MTNRAKKRRNQYGSNGGFSEKKGLEMAHNNGCLGRGRKYTINGETMTVPEFSRKYKLHESVIRGRLKAGAADNLMFLSAEEYRRATHYNATYLQRNECCSWTQSAIDCYDIGGDCRQCLLPLDLKRICHMRERIIKIVRKFGKPYERTDERNFLKDN